MGTTTHGLVRPGPLLAVPNPMTTLIRFRTLFVAAAILIAPAACNEDKTIKGSDEAAAAVKKSADRLREEAREVSEVSADRRQDLSDKAGDNARDVADEAKDVGKGARKLANDEHDFQYAKMVRVQTLRSVHAVIASQPMVMSSFAASLPIVESDRAMINEKMQILQMRLDEAGNQIETLNSISAESWEQRHDDVNKAMERLDDAREDAWKALDEAKRLDRTSMR